MKPIRLSGWLTTLLLATRLRCSRRRHRLRPNARPRIAWKLKSKSEVAGGTIYDLHLVSQVWQGITWEHQLQVYLPSGVKPTKTMFLWNQGGKASPASIALGMDFAKKMNAPVAFLYGIPNQPLFDGKKEDALIAETFVRYLQTNDASWPLLFPMAKSLTRAMDALQAFAKQEWQIEVTHFVVSGGSKRGWTTWLTAAADARVQSHRALRHRYAEHAGPVAASAQSVRPLQRHDRRLHQAWISPNAGYAGGEKALGHGRSVELPPPRVKQPTMIINGTNDPYWTQDALNLYWDDLKMDKWLLYVPNAGHNLAEKTRGANDPA